MIWRFLMIQSSTIIENYFSHGGLKNSIHNRIYKRICFIHVEENPSPNDASVVKHSKHMFAL